MDKFTDHPRDSLTGNEFVGGNTPGSLRHLSDLDDYGIVDGEPDIRGWDVRSSDGVKVGEVKDLVVDCGSLAVRYMEVELDDDLTAIDDDRHVLLPLGTARLNDDEDVVLLRSTTAEVVLLPKYQRDSKSEIEAASLHTRYGHGTEHDDQATDAFFGARRLGRERDAYLRRR